MDRTFDPDKFIERIGQRLIAEFDGARNATSPGTVGSAMEESAKKQLEQILPRGLAVGSGFVIDSYGGTSKQTDIVIYERDICPVFSINDAPETAYYPCECVVAVGEVKSAIDQGSLKDAFEKIASVKMLRRHTVHDLRPDPRTGQGIPVYRSYGSLHGNGIINFDEKPGELGEIFCFVLAGDSRLRPETLASHFLELARRAGDELSPNLLAVSRGVTLSWVSITRALSTLHKKDDGTYSRVTDHGGGHPRWEPQLSARTGDILRLLDDGEAFRAIVQCVRTMHLAGRTSRIDALDRYFIRRGQPQPAVAAFYRRDGTSLAGAG